MSNYLPVRIALSMVLLYILLDLTFNYFLESKSSILVLLQTLCGGSAAG